MIGKIKKTFSALLAACMLCGAAAQISAEEALKYKIEGEWYQGSAPTSPWNDPKFSGGTLLNVDKTEENGLHFENYVYNYDLCVTKSGYYKLTYLGMWGPVEIRVGDGIFAPVDKGANTTPAAGQEAAWGNLYETTVWMDAGENTVTFAITSSVLPSQPNRVVFNMDWFELEYIGTDADTVVRLEGESHTGSGSRMTGRWDTGNYDRTPLSGSDALMVEGGPETIDFVLNAPYDGEYEVSGEVSILNNMNYSTFALLTGDQSYDFSSATTTQNSEATTNICALPFYTTKLNQKVALQQGDNAITIRFNKRYQGNYYGGFDYLDFKYVSAGAKPSLVFEAENQPNDAFVSKGSYLMLEKKKTEETPSYELTQTFDVPYTGNYTLAVILGHVSGYTSPTKIKVNDGEYISVEDTEKVRDEALDYSCGADAHRFTFVDAISLQAGTNNITFLADAAGSKRSDSMMYVYIDKYELKPEAKAAKAELAIDADFLKKGEAANASVKAYNAYDYALSAEDYTVSYTSSDENVAVVDESGVITANNTGNVTITAAVTAGGETATAEKKLVVYNGTEGLVVLGAEAADNGVKVRYANVNSTATNTYKFIAAVYGRENGTLTSLKACAEALVSIQPTIVHEKVIPVTYTSGDAVKLLLWESLETARPIFAATDVQ